jgi:tetratricopeptide (TPR) repeat protein
MADDMFQDAVEALKRGDKARAKELLTLLLKADQNNATYWTWMSAVVDSPKERVYCLQTALKLDPENATAKRGLVLLGAQAPDENIQPFRLDRPRAWEDKLLLAHEQPRATGFRALSSSPVARLAGIGVVGLLICGLSVYALLLPRDNRFSLGPTFTPGPSPTYTLTPTLIGAEALPTPTYIGPTPLWAFLPATYTPTPLYVNTPRQPQSADQFRIARAAYAKGDWDEYIDAMEDLLRLEPDSADIYYLIGEAHRFDGNARAALVAYNDALKIDDNFGAAYLGLARARLLQDPNVDVTPLLDLALQYDPNFGEIYLERAYYHLYHKDPESALSDLRSAEQRMPDSALVYLGYARAYLMLEDTATALENAEQAHEIDFTLLPVYLILGETYVTQGDYAEAIEMLTTYATYEPDEGRAFALLGQAYYELEDFASSVSNLTKGLSLDSSQRQVYLYRGLAYLEMGNAEDAQADMERAAPFYQDSLEIKLGLTRSYYMQEKYGSAFLQIEAARSLTRTNQDRALVLYWRALVQEQRGEIADAVQTWQDLLDLPVTAMSEEMRTEADQHVRTIALITPSPTGRTPTRTPTRPVGTRTPTRTPTP